ncbi:hypothetical protein CIPAW_05G234600 [Carya illinoinensis]|uniref:Wall-associated receptor kinase galacturonan-binding domain-containing protein n=2 Tax=Carya illinoinensis TaxID=32201 RepID=A0A8T1QNB8_CARIL|nr:hypothetical protein CIPAW_05G234600 [Carya illinoinensis]
MTAFPAGLMVLLIAVVVFLHLLPQDNYCAPSSCGNIPNISFPFRLKSDPLNCGDTRYELLCDENNHTLLSLHGSKYYVSQIDYNNYTIRIIDAGIQEDNYSFIPCYSLNRRGLNNWDSDSGYVIGFWRKQARLIDASEVVVIVNCEKPVAPVPLSISSRLLRIVLILIMDLGLLPTPLCLNIPKGTYILLLAME